MHLHEMAPIRFLLQALPQKSDRKTIGIAAAALILGLILILFGDILLPLFGHGLYLLIELIEQESEDFLEFAFGLSTRQAQILIVWVGLPIIGYFLWRRLRKVFAAIKARWLAFIGWVNGDWSQEEWLRILLVVAMLGVILYFTT